MEDNADNGDWNCVSPFDDKSGIMCRCWWFNDDSIFTGPLTDGFATPKFSLAGLESSETDIDLAVCSTNVMLFSVTECPREGIVDLPAADTVWAAGGAIWRSYAWLASWWSRYSGTGSGFMRAFGYCSRWRWKWTLRFPLVVNRLPHMLHLYGRSPDVKINTQRVSEQLL